MEDREKLTQEHKEQLLRRVKDCLDEDALNIFDWMKIYDILLEACEREHAEAYEDLVAGSFKVEGDTT